MQPLPRSCPRRAAGRSPSRVSTLWGRRASLVLTGMIVASCTLACSQGEARSKRKTTAPQPSTKAPALAQGKTAPKVFTAFPTVDMSGLGAAETLMFQQIVNEEICPCSCPKSFAACLQAGTKCEPAVILANWMTQELRQGVPGEIIADQIAKEIAGGYAGQPKSPSLAGYASKGASNAPYTIVEYADFECGHCKLASPVMEQFVKKHPREVRVVFKHFPLSFHEMATPAAAAAEAAGNQGKFWEMHNAIFATQTMLDEDLLLGHARALGLDMNRFEKDFRSKDTLAKVKASRDEGEKLGVEATPTFYINGRPFNLMRTPEAFEARLQMERARKTSRCE